jgi:rhodanese-related sulfurtransferase
VEQLDPIALKHHLESGPRDALLLDVREPWEYEICHIDGSVNVPLARIQDQADNWGTAREVVLICHHGMRSYQAGILLERAGVKRVVNLAGGIDAWAQSVEPNMPRY